MSVQFTDGSFSDTMPFEDAVEEFQNALDNGTARALFVGSEREIEAIKTRRNLEDEISDLKKRLSKVEEGPVKSETVIIPTRDEIISALRGSSLGTVVYPGGNINGQ